MFEVRTRAHRCRELEVFFQKTITGRKMANKIALGYSRSRKVRDKLGLRIGSSVFGDKEVTARHLAFVTTKPSLSIVQ